MENIVVALIVLAAVAFAVRSLYRTWTGRGGCSCGGSCKKCGIVCRSAKK